MKFTTLPCAPKVSIEPPASVTVNSVVLNGNIAAMGGATQIDPFFELSPRPLSGYMQPIKSLTAAGTFSLPVSGLACGTIYVATLMGKYMANNNSSPLTPNLTGGPVKFTTLPCALPTPFQTSTPKH